MPPRGDSRRHRAEGQRARALHGDPCGTDGQDFPHGCSRGLSNRSARATMPGTPCLFVPGRSTGAFSAPTRRAGTLSTCWRISRTRCSSTSSRDGGRPMHRVPATPPGALESAFRKRNHREAQGDDGVRHAEVRRHLLFKPPCGSLRAGWRGRQRDRFRGLGAFGPQFSAARGMPSGNLGSRQMRATTASPNPEPAGPIIATEPPGTCLPR